MKRKKRIIFLAIILCCIVVIIVPWAVNANRTVLAFKDKTDWPVGCRYKWHISWCYQNYGQRNNRFHYGVDINLGRGKADLGAPVFATHDGVVDRVRTIKDDKNGGGNRVRIISENGKVSTFYMHLDSISVRKGEKITKGTQLGTLGGSGFGKRRHYVPHLHYEVFIDGKHINPVQHGNLVSLQ